LRDIHWQWYYGANELYKDLVDTSLEFFKEPGVVLDVGCGDGVSSCLLAKKGFYVVGIDTSETGIKIAKEKNPGGDFRVASAEEMAAISQHEFDYLYSLNTIEHVAVPAAYIELMQRVRKFGIIITDDGLVRKKGPYDNQIFTIETLRELFKDFRVEEFKFKTDIANKKFIGIQIWPK